MATPSSTSPENASESEPQGSHPQADEQVRRDLPEFFRALQRAQREILRRVTAGLALAHLAALGVITLLLVVIDQLVSIPETASFLVAAFISLFMLASLLVFLLRVYYRKPAESLIAQRVEAQNPGFKDALVCATEVTQKWREGRQPGRIEKALVERVAGESGGIDFQRAAVPRALGWHYLALAAILVLLLFFGLSGTQFLGKASAGLGRFLGQTPPGLVVEPGDLSVPENGDVQVIAQVLRWQDEAVIEYQSPEGQEIYPMYAQEEEGRHAFTIYGITDPVRYRVKTPSLSSRWFQLDTYLPPAIRETEIIIEAPAYTETETQTLDRLQTLKANEGSRISWEMTTRGTEKAELSMTGPEGETRVMPLNAGEGTTESFTLEMRAQRSADFFLTLTSPEGRQWKSPTYALEVKPDLSPVVEILQPAKDTRLTPADGLEVAGQASDDYGLRELSLWFQVAGKEPVGGPLFQSADHQGETPRTRYESAPVRMEHLEVEAGDLVSYYMEAVDNREPEPNVSRSEIYFIEIVEPVTAQQMEGQQGQPQQMEVRSLIEGMKQAIRLSYQAQEAKLSGSEAALESAREQLQAKLLETRANAQQKITELTDMTGLSSGFDMMDNLTAAVENMQEAERAALAQRDSEVVEPSQQAIKELLKVEQQLMQNTADQMASQMEDLGKQDQQQQQQAQQQGQQSPRDAMEQMRQAASELRRLAEEQNALNQGLRAAGGQQVSEQEQQQLSERQADLQERAGQQQQQMAQNQGSQGAMAMEPLEQAANQMQEALRDINQGDMRSASADGERARESLSQAAEAMEQQIQNVLRRQTEALAQMARQLQGRQQQQAQQSAQLADQEVERTQSTQMMEDQQQLRENYREVLDAARSLSTQAAQNAPRAGNQMQDALQRATEANTEGQMTRAANALLYQRMETASQSQQQAAQQIGEFAQNLDEAAQSMPRLSQEQIAQAMEALQRARARMEALANQQAQSEQQGQEQGQNQGENQGQSGQEQGQPSRQEGQQASSEGQSGSPTDSAAQQAQQSASQMLDDLARTLQDDQLQELANTMAAREGGGSGTLTQSSEDLRMAIDYIRQNLLQIERQRRARLKRQSAPPPGEYRQLVEEYFKILGGAGAEASQP